MKAFEQFEIAGLYYGFNRITGDIVQFDSKRESELMCSQIMEADHQLLINSYTEAIEDLAITVELNSICNLDCVYCYQADKGSRDEISQSTISSVVKYVSKVYCKSKFRILELRFIGGEPLLSIEKLLQCYREMEKFCSKNRIKLMTHIDTNGTIPFCDLIHEISDLDLVICLSTEADHDKKRSNSYKKILSNLREASKFDNCPITLRYNVSHDNYELFEEFLNFVRKELPHIQIVNTARIDDGVANSKYKNLMDEKSFASWNATSAIDLLIKYHFPISHCTRSRLVKCQGYSKHSCKIYADGAVTVCDAMYHDKSVLTVNDLLHNPDLLYIRYAEIKNYMPAEDSECSKCDFIIQCGGKHFCRNSGNPCEYQAEYNENDFVATYIKHFINGNAASFINMT